MELVEFQMYRSMKNDESLQSGKLSTILSLHSFSLDHRVSLILAPWLIHLFVSFGLKSWSDFQPQVVKNIRSMMYTPKQEGFNDWALQLETIVDMMFLCKLYSFCDD